jgi:hypothetical protein
MRLLRAITQSPYLNLVVGLILVLASGDEVFESIRDGFNSSDLNVNFSATVVGFVQILRALPDLVEGLEYVQRSRAADWLQAGHQEPEPGLAQQEQVFGTERR